MDSNSAGRTVSFSFLFNQPVFIELLQILLDQVLKSEFLEIAEAGLFNKLHALPVI